MNNTFVLSIFLCIVYFKNIAWQFSAEVCCIIFVEVGVGLIALSKVQNGYKGIMAGILYPAALILVIILESPAVGWN